MHKSILAVRQIFYQPVTVADTVEGLPSADLPAIRRIVDDVQGFLKIGVAAAKRIGIEIKPQDDINIVSNFSCKIGRQRFRTLHPVFIEIQWLKFSITESKGFILEIDQRTLIG